MTGYYLQQLVNGIMLGSLYALVAIGFSMIYGIVRLINFAHGDLMMVGAFGTLGLVASGVPWPLVFLFVVALGALSGITIERAEFRPMRGAPQVTGFIATLAVAILIQNAMLMTLTGQPRNFMFPDALRARVALGPSAVGLLDLVIILISVVVCAALVVLSRRTRLGIAMRAVADNLVAARLMGIPVNRTIMLAFAIGSAIAALAGLLWGGRFGQIDPLMGFQPGLKAFVACVIGGVGSITGAMLGGYLLGIAEVMFIGLLPPALGGYRDAFVFALLIVVLLVMPNGLLGRSEEERA